MKQPCPRDCPKRAPGCGSSCPDWAEYLKWREKEYKNRLEAMKVNDAVVDGRRRCGKYVPTN